MSTHARIELDGAIEPGFEEVLTPEALEFLAELERQLRASAARAARSARAAARAAAGGRAARLPAGDARDPRGRLAASRRRRPTCSSGGSRSPARPTAR